MVPIKFLDHVALRCRDIHASADWYEQILGLKRYQPKVWGPFPIFMLAGKTGLALFPVKGEPQRHPERGLFIDHIAFQVAPEDLEHARRALESQGISTEFQDHHYFHSVYFKDPDGHQLELTTIVVPEEEFYRP